MANDTYLDYSDASGTITTGGVAQSITVPNAYLQRKSLIIQNISDTPMYINIGSTATSSSGSFLLAANGGVFNWSTPGFVPQSTTISILCATTGKAFTCKYCN